MQVLTPYKQGSFLNKETTLSSTQTALFSTMAVVIALSIAQFYSLASVAGYLVVAMQSVTGLTISGSYKERLITSANVALILTATAGLSVLAKENLIISVLATVVLAFSFGYWRQLFPLNWAEIIIPAGVIFFMPIAHTIYAEPIIATAIGGMLALLCQALLGIFVTTDKKHKQAEKEKDPLSVPTTSKVISGDKVSHILYLKADIFMYCLELSFLLAVGTLIYKLADFERGHWIPFTAIVVLQTNYFDTKKRIGVRLVGTLMGCIVGSALLLLPLGTAAWIGLLAINIFLFLYFIRKQYALAVTFITIYVLLVMGRNLEEPSNLIWERILFTVIGGAFVIIVSFFFQIIKRMVSLHV